MNVYKVHTLSVRISHNVCAVVNSYRNADIVVRHNYYGPFEKIISDSLQFRVHTPVGFYDITTGKNYWYLNNRQGSVMAVVDAEGNVVQRTGIYPGGTPFVVDYTTASTDNVTGNSAASVNAIAPVTDRLHIGNKWMGHSGLDWYDNTARMHDPLLMRFTTPDPLADQYPDLNPWSHCAANPANSIDLDGREIYYNLNGEEVYRTDNNTTPFIVLQYSSEVAVAMQSIADNHIIPLPSLKELDLMAEAFKTTEEKNIETGYLQFMNGFRTSLIEGEKDKLVIKGSDISVKDTDGSFRANDAHTHPPGIGDENSGRNDIASKLDIAAVGEYKYIYPSMILGYNPFAIRKDQEYTTARHVAFYDKNTKEGESIERISFINFIKLVGKILGKTISSDK